ncbi:helix-turn-helix domain-containing protein [Eubacterium sp.]|uniref:helix-turn-helix domain-containing protein n=1 Tax=Eubacterium sp. TaxID=142586 RepID=UPI0026DFF633|nr:helix-turn-helix transcriptional regulator [Eubacterium sp.]MDO5432915.1 helix-turn-helix transcriptional regulator [Eubacterium sp.]
MNNDFIKNMRTYRNMTQQNLANASGVNIRQIQRIEKGETDANKLALKNAVALMDALGVQDVHLIIGAGSLNDYAEKMGYNVQQLALFFLGCAFVECGYFRAYFKGERNSIFPAEKLSLTEVEKFAMNVAAFAYQKGNGIVPYQLFYNNFDREVDHWQLRDEENARYIRDGMLIGFSVFSYTELFGENFKRKGEKIMNENVAYAEKESTCGGGYPNLDIGDVVALGEVWSGEGENPMDDLYEGEGSYAYFIKDDEWISYIFKPTGNQVDSESYSKDARDEVEITNIEIV